MPRILLTIIKFFTLLAGTALALVLVTLGVFVHQNSAPAAGLWTETDGIRIEADSTAYIEVKKGESARSVGLRLENAHLIRSRYFWYFLCRFNSEFIKSGFYRIDVPASQMAIHGVLVSVRQLLRRVTVPEGVTLKKTAKILEDAGICAADAFLAASAAPETIKNYRIPGPTMEGYLFPDTYLFPADYPAGEVVKTMADNFFSKVRDIYAEALALRPEELNRLVILASIVEREYRLETEAPLMAGVFFNRLDIGMALQSCATVEYVITEIQGRPHPEVLSTRDTEIRDPYNTYVRPGLPPGPISAPGATALQAAFHPAASEYLYFRLVDPSSGRHYFSRTLDDHIRAGILYVKGR